MFLALSCHQNFWESMFLPVFANIEFDLIYFLSHMLTELWLSSSSSIRALNSWASEEIGGNQRLSPAHFSSLFVLKWWDCMWNVFLRGQAWGAVAPGLCSSSRPYVSPIHVLKVSVLEPCCISKLLHHCCCGPKWRHHHRSLHHCSMWNTFQLIDRMQLPLHSYWEWNIGNIKKE